MSVEEQFEMLGFKLRFDDKESIAYERKKVSFDFSKKNKDLTIVPQESYGSIKLNENDIMVIHKQLEELKKIKYKEEIILKKEEK